MEQCTSLITKLCNEFSSDVPFAAPISSLKTNELDLVRGVLHMLQGLSSSLFYWDDERQSFCVKSGIYVAHLSLTSLRVILNQFTYASTCLKLIENVVNKVERHVKSPSPTLRAFSCSISAWLKRLRDISLKEEENISNSRGETAPTLLGLASSLSSLCSGAEFLLQIVHGAIPKGYLKLGSSVPAAEIAVHILDYLYKKINEICSVQGGEEDGYRMLLYIFIGSLLSYIEGLDSWLFEGTLDDPFEEMFFYANRAISVHDADFWEKSYLLRIKRLQKLEFSGVMDFVPSLNDRKDISGSGSIPLSSSENGIEQNNKDYQICPLFIKEIANAVVSAGKSLQLIRHAPTVFSTRSGRRETRETNINDKNDLSKINIPSGHGIDGLTLSEVFCVSLAALIGHGDRISKYFWQDEPLDSKVAPLFLPLIENHKLEGGSCNNLPTISSSEKAWYKLLVDTLYSNKKINLDSVSKKDERTKEENIAEVFVDDFPCLESFCHENPVITVCQKSLHNNKKAWGALNLSKNIYLPPLDDDELRRAIFGGKHEPDQAGKGTNYAFGFQFGESERLRSHIDTKILETLFPFPTLLPSFQEKLRMSEFLPFQRNSTLPSRVLSWIQSVEPKVTPLPVTLLQESLIIYIKKQVDYIGRNMLSKLLCEWRLMDELGILRAIYLLGSGDLLQHFLTVTFDKLDTGESWEDDFELNMILQESIANSADGMVLSAPDSLVVSISKGLSSNEQQNTTTVVSSPRKNHCQNFGIDGLDSLTFSYKVPWPLELIINAEALKKYNQVMIFLLKVKRAKFVLDKARRWMWKRRGSVTINSKRHWLVEQKLLHFVDAFHQYVMDRVYHSAWRELCEGMATAASLDEVIEVHEAYLLLIQRQCFVVPDKLWALIASRINSILGLALDFYSIQQTLNSGGAISTVKARCEIEVDRIEKQFDECIAFLLKVLSFKLNVGHFPHLADLVTRINYNYYYMSDNGSLNTTPGSSETASKLGKTFNARTNSSHNS